jgi:hypothetical protein
MDAKKASRQLANGFNKKKSDRNVAEQKYGKGHSWSQGVNRKEEAIIDALDQKNFLLKHANWIEQLQDGRINVEGFLGALAPDVAIKLAELAFGGESDKVRLDAIKDFLDRAGFSKVNKHAVAAIDPNAPKEQLISLIEGLGKKNQDIEFVDDLVSEAEDPTEEK